MGIEPPAGDLPMDLPFRQSTEVHRCNVLPFKEAIVADVHESKIVDKIRLKAYEMLPRIILQVNDERRSGSSYAQEVGFSLNGDNENTGIRIFSHASFKLTPVVTAFGFSPESQAKKSSTSTPRA